MTDNIYSVVFGRSVRATFATCIVGMMLVADLRAMDSPPGPGGSFDGQILVTPLMAKETVLINPDKTEAHIWKSAHFAGAGARLLADGSILRIANSGGARPYSGSNFKGGRVQRIAWDGRVIWDFWNAAEAHMVCGDAIQLPNGNILMSVVEFRSKEDCLALGRDPKKVTDQGLFAPGLMEFAPNDKNGGKLVWRWSLWDHLSQSSSPNIPGYDPGARDSHRPNIEMALPGIGMSFTQISYHAGSDLIAVTVPRLGEVWVLDHSASMAESKTSRGGLRRSGGGLLLRWKASPSDPDKPVLRVASAEFTSPSDSSTLASLIVMTRSPVVENSVCIRVNSVRLVEHKINEMVRLEGLESAEHSWTTGVSSMLDTPTDVAEVSNGSWLVTAGAGGLVNLVASDGQKMWDFLNQRGKTKYEIRKLQSGEPFLDADVMKKAKSQSVQKGETAGISGARYYSGISWQEPVPQQPEPPAKH